MSYAAAAFRIKNPFTRTNWTYIRDSIREVVAREHRRVPPHPTFKSGSYQTWNLLDNGISKQQIVAKEALMIMLEQYKSLWWKREGNVPCRSRLQYIKPPQIQTELQPYFRNAILNGNLWHNNANNHEKRCIRWELTWRELHGCVP